MARDPITRGLRDEADVGPAPRPAQELKRLSELPYQVADGEPDVRGWRVYASTGRELGTVSDLLVDTEAGEVVMLDVDLRRNDRHTLAPVRAAWVDHATRRVVLDAREAERADAAAGAPAGGAADAPTHTRTDAPDADDRLPALPRAGALSDAEVRRFNDDYARAYGERGVDADRGYRVRRGDDELRFAAGPRRLLDPAAAAGTAGPAERRTDRVDDASALDDAQGIDPRELDARVRIDEGATVDADAPVAGVRYDTPDAPPHSYGRPADAYGPDYGDGRINLDHVSRGPYTAGGADAPAEARPVRYRAYGDRYTGPEGQR